MLKPDISIITATYNAADTLEPTLQSVEQQTYINFEHLIVDGGSKDQTLSLVDAYIQRNPNLNISCVSEPDRGLYDALNKGIARAKGKYIVFLNAGDSFHSKDTLETVTQRILPSSSLAFGKGDEEETTAHIPTETEPAVIYGETDLVDHERHFLRHRRLKAPKQLTWKSFQQGMLVCHQSFYARRDLVPTYDLQYRFSADFDWCIRVLKEAQQQHLPIVNTGAILTDYLSEGLTTQNHKASLHERFDIMAKHYGRLKTYLLHAWFAVRAVFKK